MPRCDEETLTRAVEALPRDRDGSFSVLYACFYPRIRRFFTRKGVQPAEEALDLTQSTFLRLYKGLRNFRGSSLGELGAFLHRIAQNNFLHWLETKQRRVPTDPLFTDTDEDGRPDQEPVDLEQPSALDMTLRHETAHKIRRALLELPERRRQCLTLRIVQGLSYKQIGEVLNMAHGTVAATIHQGRAALAELLTGELEPEELERFDL